MDPPVHRATPTATARVATVTRAAAQRRTSNDTVPTMELPSQAQVAHLSAPTGPTSGTDSAADAA
jgi:hypothetical protein